MSDLLSQLNFRDLGGLEAADGRRIKSGVLYRSEGPRSYTPAHRDALAALGVKLVCDLRSDVERSAAMHDWGPSASVLELNLADDFGAATASGRRMVQSDPTPAGACSAICTSYSAMPAALQAHLPGVVQAMLSGGVPLLVHCTAGKDRTGVMIALLLTLLGVPRETVISEYLLSAGYADATRARGDITAAFSQLYGVPLCATTVDAIIGVDRQYIVAAFESIEATWGTPHKYYESIGLRQSDQARLANLLTE
jgi:protein-tyrosine phosphatase